MSGSDSEGEADPWERPTTAEARRRACAGMGRRRKMREGIRKGLLGNLKKMITAIALITVTAGNQTVQHASGLQQRMFGTSRPDVVEVFGGECEVSFRFARAGFFAGQPYDIRYGTDLLDPSERARLLQTLASLRPRLAIVAFPCTVWSSMCNINFRTQQARRLLAKRRREQLPFLELTNQIFLDQMERGDDALGEQPLLAASLKQEPIASLLAHGGVYVGVGHACMHNMRSSRDGGLLKKPTCWFSMSREIVAELAVKCNGKHQHSTCLGGSVCRAAGAYTPEIGRAVVRGVKRTMARKEPGRLQMWRRGVETRHSKE